MPSPNNTAKASGDVHLPEIESEDLDAQASHPDGAGVPGTQERERDERGVGSPARGEGHAGTVRKDD